jgi:Protein of unknown function (DUF4236)
MSFNLSGGSGSYRVERPSRPPETVRPLRLVSPRLGGVALSADEMNVGLYLRKTIKIGPFRFNLSKSGVGVSTGVKGLTFGAGPRGKYIHIGRYGIHYRAKLSTLSKMIKSLNAKKPAKDR